MTEKSILFSAPMVLAVLDGRKTQTRRIAKDVASPAMLPGDKVWVRENFRLPLYAFVDSLKPGEYAVAPDPWVAYEADNQGNDQRRLSPKVTPSIHMPRVCSRIDLECTGTRLERLHLIDDADAIAEGIYPAAVYGPHAAGWLIDEDSRQFPYERAVEAYRALWIRLNGQASWDANPYVWVYSFERIKP